MDMHIYVAGICMSHMSGSMTDLLFHFELVPERKIRITRVIRVKCVSSLINFESKYLFS